MQLKKKLFYLNPNFNLTIDFCNIFIKTYDPLEKVKIFFKNQNLLELIIVNNSIKNKLFEP
jgi:hypothetical protein